MRVIFDFRGGCGPVYGFDMVKAGGQRAGKGGAAAFLWGWRALWAQGVPAVARGGLCGPQRGADAAAGLSHSIGKTGRGHSQLSTNLYLRNRFSTKCQVIDYYIRISPFSCRIVNRSPHARQLRGAG